MIRGIKSLPEGEFCAYCNAKVNLDMYNFCPKCGNPLNDNAIGLREEQDKRVKMEVLDEISNEINDTKSLKIIAEYLKK